MHTLECELVSASVLDIGADGSLEIVRWLWAGVLLATGAGDYASKEERTRGMGLLNDFKAFIMRGNVVDLAVAVVIGAAFKSIVDALVADFITPLLAAVAGKSDFSSLTFEINGSIFRYGDFFNQVLSFVIIAAVIFFLVITPLNALMARAKKEPPVDPTVRKCPECTSEINLAARRCPFCTAQIAAAA